MPNECRYSSDYYHYSPKTAKMKTTPDLLRDEHIKYWHVSNAIISNINYWEGNTLINNMWYNRHRLFKNIWINIAVTEISFSHSWLRWGLAINACTDITLWSAMKALSATRQPVSVVVEKGELRINCHRILTQSQTITSSLTRTSGVTGIEISHCWQDLLFSQQET